MTELAVIEGGLPQSYRSRLIVDDNHVADVLLFAQPGAIIETSLYNRVDWIGPEIEDYSRVAGLISDAA